MSIYLHHITVTTGHASRSRREDVPDSALNMLRPWIADCLATGETMAIPEVAPYRGQCLREGGALMCTVWAHATDIGNPDPIVTFGVAARSRDARRVWDVLIATPGEKPADLAMPGAPFCGVIIHPTAARHPDAFAWLGLFEQVVSWAWVTKNPGVETA